MEKTKEKKKSRYKCVLALRAVPSLLAETKPGLVKLKYSLSAASNRVSG